MKASKAFFSRYSAITILILSTVVIGFMYWRLEKTGEMIAKDLLQEPLDLSKERLDRYFYPIINDIQVNKERLRSEFEDTLEVASQLQFFKPTIYNYEQISSMGLAHSGGYELDILPDTIQNRWKTRMVYVDRYGMKEYWNDWQVAQDRPQRVGQYIQKLKTDPRDRPWYTGILKMEGQNAIHWTNPYLYNTIDEIGITASVKWTQKNKDYILAYDLTLTDLSHFTANYEVSKHGFVFLMNKGFEMIGLPKHQSLESHKRKAFLLLPPEKLDVPLLQDAYAYWTENNNQYQAFSFKSSGDKVWAKIVPYELSDGHYIYLGVVIPEQDLIANLNRTKLILLLGYVVIFLLTLFVLYSKRQVARKNKVLNNKNVEIEEQKHIIEEKNKDITDSINYAFKIQNALLSTRENLLKNAPNAVLFFLPKDIVSGDFYFYEKFNRKHMFCVADCTGHGVPGALMSVMGLSYFQKYLHDSKITHVGEILDHVRSDIINALKSEDGGANDGMDAAFIQYENGKIAFAGAQNPMYLLRKRENVSESLELPVADQEGQQHIVEASVYDNHYVLFPIKADKQPIGNFIEQKPFTAHYITAMPGDKAFIFSDGYADQFGGPKGKKFRYKPFKKLILSLAKLESRESNQQLASFFEEWQGSFDQVDDVCVMGINFDDLKNE